jgi:hypothetical protein
MASRPARRPREDQLARRALIAGLEHAGLTSVTNGAVLLGSWRVECRRYEGVFPSLSSPERRSAQGARRPVAGNSARKGQKLSAHEMLTNSTETADQTALCGRGASQHPYSGALRGPDVLPGRARRCQGVKRSPVRIRPARPGKTRSDAVSEGGGTGVRWGLPQTLPTRSSGWPAASPIGRTKPLRAIRAADCANTSATRRCPTATRTQSQIETGPQVCSAKSYVPKMPTATEMNTNETANIGSSSSRSSLHWPRRRSHPRRRSGGGLRVQ